MGPQGPAGTPSASEADRDARLLADHVAGDPDAFGVLFGRHRDRLWAVALRTTGDPEDAADALQDAMVSAFTRADSFRGGARVSTWLHRIVVNACLDRLRRRRVRAADPLPEDAERGDQTPVGSGSTPTDPEHSVIRRSQQEQVLAALDTLPTEQRTALVLVDMEGFSVREAAGVLQCSEGTVKSRCSRGRARLLPLLRHLLPDSWNPDEAPHVSPTRPAGQPQDNEGR